MGKDEVVVEVQAQCGCCGMWEECTSEYIKRVKETFGGAWVCGLCAEAIKDEQARLGGGVGVEAAMLVHAKFREISSVDPTVRIAMSLLRLFKKMMMPSDSAASASASASASRSSSTAAASAKL